jgi:hypothetical protein
LIAMESLFLGLFHDLEAVVTDSDFQYPERICVKG